MMAALEGKVAGLDIAPPSAGAAASTKIRLRGQSSFAGATNSPLIVVNGLPMNQGANGANGNDSRDNGDNLLLFNPDDIENVTVLKGATAAALYGSRAGNGAIVITTKSGAKNTGIGVEFSSNYTVDKVIDLTDYQYEFGQGQNGARPANQGAAIASGQFGWGERFDGAPTAQFDGVQRPYSPHHNYMTDFFETGKSLTNTIAFSGGTPKGSFRVSFSNNDAKGITPGNEYHRKIVNVGVNHNLSDKLSVQFNLNYTNDKNVNPPQVGVQGQGYMNFLVRMSPVVPLSVFNEKAANDVGAETQTNGFGTTILNPYFYIPRQFYKNYGDRLLGTVTVKYQFLEWLYLQGRVNMDYGRSFNERNDPTGGGGFGTANSGIYYDNTRTTYNGSFNVNESSGKQMNYEAFLGGNHRFGKFSVDAFVGGNILNTPNRNINTSAQAFIIKDLYSIGNGTVFTQGYTYSQTQVNSVFGSAEFGYNNLAYITVTGRNDWFSILNPKSNSYFYPSVSGSFVFSELFKDKFSWLDYGKVRASWADVGSANGPGLGAYNGNLTYNFSTQPYLGRTIGSINQVDAPNPFLKPFSIKEKEIGIELKMFDSRLNLDVAAYDKKTTDQIMSRQASAASGYNNTLINVGSLQNRGLEIMLDVVPVRTRDFTWNSTFNTAYNASKVLDMGQGVTRFTVVDWYNGGASNEFMGKQVYEVGKPLAQIAAKTYLTNDKGEILVNSTGRLVASQQEVLFGSALPKYTGGWNNNLRYKNLSLLVHFDFKAGGKMLSGSALNSLRQGHSKASLVGRRTGETGVVFPGIYRDGPNAGKVNTTAVYGQQFYADYRSLQIADPFIYKSDYFKLRTISLTYDFTRLVGGQAKFIKGLLLSASCRNVAILKKFVPDLDPEAVASSGDQRAGYEAVSLPTTRAFGLNLNVKF
jgi:TonB-linked SusC/RagA family outer membrane protein